MSAVDPQDARTRAQDDFDKLVAAEANTLRVRAAARDLLTRERTPPLADLDAGLLGEILARPPLPRFRVDDLIPSDASTLIVGQNKTSKTTLGVNLAWSLLTGEPFLAAFDVQPIAGRVGFLNYEVSAAQLARWAHERGIDHNRFAQVNLRGRGNPLAAGAGRERLAAWLRGHDVETLIVDPFGRAYTGESQNDNGEVGTWLMDLDTFARTEVGARDLILTAHAGWNGERTRGASALPDWADSIITLTSAGDENGDRPRFMSAVGRDVDVPEDRLMYDPDTRTLTLTGSGSRKAATAERAVDAAKVDVLRYVTTNPGCSGNDIERNVVGNHGVVTKARRALVASGELIEETRTGKGGGKTYRFPEPPPTSPNLPRGDLTTSPTSPIGGRLLGGSTGPNLPQTPTCGEPLDPVLGGLGLHPGRAVTL